MIWLAVAFFATVGHHTHTNAAIEKSLNKTVKLVEKIRRQLMEDNYDYLPSETELITPSAHLDPDAPNDELSDAINDNPDDSDRGNDNFDRNNKLALDRGIDNYRLDNRNGDNNNDKATYTHNIINRFIKKGNDNYKVVDENKNFVYKGKGYSRVIDKDRISNKGNDNNFLNIHDKYNDRIDDKNKDVYSRVNDNDKHGGKDNYGYFETEKYTNSNNDKYDVHNSELRDQQSENEDYFVRRAREDNAEPPRPDHVVSKNDLLYYMDDERLRMRRVGEAGGVGGVERGGSSPDNASAVDDFEDDNATDLASANTVKYKVIKVKSANPSRRSGSSVRRFIQEESAAGVALIRLDDAPFPAFRLPRARRQYMRARTSAERGDQARQVLPPLTQR